MSEYVTGSCRYAYNASENYALFNPATGGGTESHCGALTYPLVDDPEIAPVTTRPAEGEPYITYQRTGHYLPRAQPDPYCPKHGGTAPPPAPVVTAAAVLAAHQQAQALAESYHQQLLDGSQVQLDYKPEDSEFSRVVATGQPAIDKALESGVVSDHA